ncbi:MAG: C25 family cysteine peptidase [Bacteroides sp.]|nr:C25 family cysteine peptidase [Bacteroides sp.]MCM1379752.1 C25 family cysteine peptidase [Bacteroides sp.]MCM1445707.1 C25 family cysteine peptidase [Prevotella sp.]
MASGHWVKIRVHGDSIYQLTYSQLRELGFQNPENVNVFGYAPTLLLTHNENTIPSDLTPVYTLHSPANQKLMFYGKGDTDYAPELWQSPNANTFSHSKHASSTRATYFLSDAQITPASIGTVNAPVSISSIVLSDHTSIVYHEDDITNFAEGGCWFTGNVINSAHPSETFKFSVSKIADTAASMYYSGIMTPALGNVNSYLLATYSQEIASEKPEVGFRADPVGTHCVFSRFVKVQDLNIPVVDEQKEYDVTFSVHPEAIEMENGSALDFFALMYQRKNDLNGIGQMHMYFHNYSAASVFKLDGYDENIRVWNVKTPQSISEFSLKEKDGSYYGALAKVSVNRPNEVIVFNETYTHPTPEILGLLDNQNLHGMSVPDLLIVTSKPLMDAAYDIADMHRRLQGLDVAVVDQQKIFNEYSSGNTSAEAVRRFVWHLYNKAPEKFRGILMLGAATYNQATLINDNNPYVVTAESENYAISYHVTTAYASDSFFGRPGTLITSGNWSSRGSQMQVLANTGAVAVGRVPLMSPAEIKEYYKKVEEYLVNNDTYGGLGNVLFASDYSTAAEDHHLTNSEDAIKSYGSKSGNDITVTRAASNLCSSRDNTVVNTIIRSALSRGVSFFTYFGHGMHSNMGGSNAATDFMFDLTSAPKMSNAGKYPLMYIGSCKVAPHDRTPDNLTAKFLSNANGGAIAVIASGREVFQQHNQTLCSSLIEKLLAANDGDWLGKIWMDAHTERIQFPGAARENVLNHITYNYFGDPALPYRAATHQVALDNATSIVMTSRNTISGRITNADGITDTDFNGQIKLSIYETPVVKSNVLGNISTAKDYYKTVTLDQDVIGEAIGKVENGVFEISFIGPTSVKTGTHRIQAFAYNNALTCRALGSVNGIEFVENTSEPEIPEAQPTKIRSLSVNENGNTSTLEAEIFIPAGIGAQSSLVSPLKLVIDGESVSQPHNLLSYGDNSTCQLQYPMVDMTHGKHTVQLSVLDAMGIWTDADLEFQINNIPESNLTASVDGQNVAFELSTQMSTDAVKKLIVERLNGDVVLSKEITSTTCDVKLAPGVYRAYVQLRSSSAASSTPKIQLLVD